MENLKFSVKLIFVTFSLYSLLYVYYSLLFMTLPNEPADSSCNISDTILPSLCIKLDILHHDKISPIVTSINHKITIFSIDIAYDTSTCCFFLKPVVWVIHVTVQTEPVQLIFSLHACMCDPVFIRFKMVLRTCCWHSVRFCLAFWGLTRRLTYLVILMKQKNCWVKLLFLRLLNSKYDAWEL